MSRNETTRNVRFYCIVAAREVTAEPNHVGQIICPACNEPVPPVVHRRRTT